MSFFSPLSRMQEGWRWEEQCDERCPNLVSGMGNKLLYETLQIIYRHVIILSISVLDVPSLVQYKWGSF